MAHVRLIASLQFSFSNYFLSFLCWIICHQQTIIPPSLFSTKLQKRVKNEISQNLPSSMNLDQFSKERKSPEIWKTFKKRACVFSPGAVVGIRVTRASWRGFENHLQLESCHEVPSDFLDWWCPFTRRNTNLGALS